MKNKFYFFTFIFSFTIFNSYSQDEKYIALGTLHSISMYKPAEVDSILQYLRFLEKDYKVLFIYDINKVKKEDEYLDFINYAKKFAKEKEITINYTLQIFYDPLTFNYKYKFQKKNGEGGFEGYPQGETTSTASLRKELRDEVIVGWSKAVRRINPENFTICYQDTLSRIEETINKQINYLKNLRPTIYKDSLERNYLMALYYFRLAAISKIEDRNAKLDSCKIMLKLAKDFNEKKIAHLHLKCQQYRQFSQQKFVQDTINNGS